MSEVARERAKWWQSQGFRELSLILWAAWNPIFPGVPTNEFESYAQTLAGLLERGESTETLAGELRGIRDKQMRGAAPLLEDLEVAELILIWFEETHDDA